MYIEVKKIKSLFLVTLPTIFSYLLLKRVKNFFADVDARHSAHYKNCYIHDIACTNTMVPAL